MSHKRLILKSTPVKGGLPRTPSSSLLLPLVHVVRPLQREWPSLRNSCVSSLETPPLQPQSLSPCSPESPLRATVRVLPTGPGLGDLSQCPLDIACCVGALSIQGLWAQVVLLHKPPNSVSDSVPNIRSSA